MKYISNFDPNQEGERQKIVDAILKNPQKHLFAIYNTPMPPHLEPFALYDYRKAWSMNLHSVAAHENITKENLSQFWDDWLGKVNIHSKD